MSINYLTEKEREQYEKIAKSGDMTIMFDFGVIIAERRMFEANLHEVQKFMDGFSHPTNCPECMQTTTSRQMKKIRETVNIKQKVKVDKFFVQSKDSLYTEIGRVFNPFEYDITVEIYTLEPSKKEL